MPPYWYPLQDEPRIGTLHLLRPNEARGTRCNAEAVTSAHGMTEDEARQAARKLCTRCLIIRELFK